MVSIEIKLKIVEHLKLSNELHIAAKEVLENGNLSITKDVATKYELYYPLLFRKVNIMKRKEKFYDRKQRLDAARKEIMEKVSTNYDASKNYELSRRTLHNEMMDARAQTNYEYDRKMCKDSVFTYLQEESLLKVLKDWAKSESSRGRCSCTFCALEKLLTLAYEFAKENNIGCTLWDTSRQASIRWLIDFEMRHTDEITNAFYSFLNVLKQIFGSDKYMQMTNKVQLLMFESRIPNC